MTKKRLAALFTAASFVLPHVAYANTCAGNNYTDLEFGTFSGMVQEQKPGMEAHRNRIFAKIKEITSADDLAVLQRDSALPEELLFSDGLAKANTVLAIANLLKEQAVEINDGDRNIKCKIALGIEQEGGALITGFTTTDGGSAVVCEPGNLGGLSLEFSTSGGIMELCAETEDRYDTNLYTPRANILLELRLRSCKAERYYEGALDIDAEYTRAEGAVIQSGNFEIDQILIFEPADGGHTQYDFDATPDGIDLMKSEAMRVINGTCQP